MKNLLISILFVPTIAIAQYKGTYETLKIREVWFMCYSSLTKHRPDTDPLFHAGTCDCYLDKLRIRFTWEQYSLLDGPDQFTETYEMTSQCILERTTIGETYG